MNETNKKIWVSDLIGDDYKKWRNENIILDCATGSGKTTFCVEVLGKYAAQCGKKILYLCNRTELHDEVLARIKAAELNNVITAMTYQYLQHLLMGYGQLQKYDYILADECHYFFTDACFNDFTDVSYRYVTEQKDSVVIYMSATAKVFFNTLKESGIVQEKNVYNAGKDYSYVDRLYWYKRDDLAGIIDNIIAKEDNSKMVVFCASSERMLDMWGLYGDKADYYCSKYSKNKELAGAVTTARDAVGPGGGESSKGGGKGESGEGSNLQDTLDVQTKAALDPEAGIPAQTEAWTALNGILDSVEQHLSNIKNILENMPEVEVTGGSLKIFATGTDPDFKIGNAYAKGVDGLKHAEKNALRSEYGQPELTVYPNGEAELTTSPVMSDLPKGTVIYNEKQTMDILGGKGAAEIGTPVTINPAFQDMAADFQKAVQSDPAALLSGISSQMENISKELQPVRVEQKNTSNSYVTTIGDIHLHEVQDVDTLGRAIATRLPTAIKQVMSM